MQVPTNKETASEVGNKLENQEQHLDNQDTFGSGIDWTVSIVVCISQEMIEII